ncbi:hypothetical protein PI125_g19698 [Phytophthora idaei]|nr:hypothetical protein PI125_g19698 [Phytophthora idaei]
MAQIDNNDASIAHSPADVFATPPCHCGGPPTRPHRVRKGDDWLTVARYNNMSRAAAYRLCKMEIQARLLVAPHVQTSSRAQKKW